MRAVKKRSSRSHFSPGWWFIILLMLVANLIVTGTLIWIVLSDLSAIRSAPVRAESGGELRATPAPAISTLPPDVTSEPASPDRFLLASARAVTPTAEQADGSEVEFPAEAREQPQIAASLTTVPSPPLGAPDRDGPSERGTAGSEGSISAPPPDPAIGTPTIPAPAPPGIEAPPLPSGTETLAPPEGLHAMIDVEGVRLQWIDEPGRRYAIYSNMASGLEMYRLIGVTEENYWIDSTVESSQTYLYRVVAVGPGIRSEAVAISISTPHWRWLGIGRPEQLSRTDHPAPMPSPTPETGPLPVTLLTHGDYLDEDAQFHILALLRNDQAVDLLDVTATIQLMDANKQILHTLDVQPYTEAVAVGETVPLHAVVAGVEPTSYSITTYGFPGRVQRPPLIVERSTGGLTEDGRYGVEGLIRNNGNTRVPAPRIAVTILDDRGHPVNLKIVMPAPAEIDAGATVTFHARFDRFPRAMTHQVFILP